jgi:hypothetical protein
MTKIVSPCDIALLGHSGSHAPQLMQSVVIIVAMRLDPPGDWLEIATEVKTKLS